MIVLILIWYLFANFTHTICRS